MVVRTMMRNAVFAGAVAIASVGLVGCGSGDAENDGAASTDTSAPPRAENPGDAQPGEPVRNEQPDGAKSIVYAVRGEVRAMPTGMIDWSVRHEAIPEFVTGQSNEDGTPKLGMNTMTMDFPTPDGYDLSGVDVGSKVMIWFEVQHAADGSLLGYEVVQHEMLPADTEMNFAPLPGMGGDN